MVFQGTDSSTRSWLQLGWRLARLRLGRPRLRVRRLISKGAKALLVLVLFSSILFPADVLRLNVAERAASPHLYSLVQWELSNFLDKWVHRAVSVFPWASDSEAARAQKVEDYFALTAARVAIADELANGDAGEKGEKREKSEAESAELTAQLKALDRSRERLRADVEETLEGVLSAVIVEEGLSSIGGLILPPVDFLLTRPPYALITSPRDRIERGDEALLRPSTTLAESVEIEEILEAQQNLSALVIPIGGVATYPASIFNERGLRWTLQLAAHEWLHHYLFFRPLGFNIFDSGDMQTLNETVADLVGREMGDRAFVMLGGLIEPELPTGEPDEKIFDFQAEMRITRLRTDELLADGETVEAELYMEARREVFVANGFNIRKLNQAYFAFNGTYAESGASASPVGGQVREYRDLSPDLGSFIDRVSSISSYEGFLAELDALRGDNVPSIADERDKSLSSIADEPNKEEVHNVVTSFASSPGPRRSDETSKAGPGEPGRRPLSSHS